MMANSFCASMVHRGKSIAATYKINYWLLPITVFIIAYGMQRSVALLGLDLHHDAFMFDAAKRFLDGETPFRDFFYQYNLGTIIFHMLALKAFGTYIASLKIATSIAYALIAVFIYLCATALGRPWQGLVMALVWSTLSPFYMPILNGYHAWSTVYMMASVMAGTWFLLMATQKRTWLYSGLAGVCFNLAFWFKQVTGLQILFVLLWILLNTRRSAVGGEIARRYQVMLIGFVLGGLLAALPFLDYLYVNNLFYDWWRSAFVFNKYFALTGASSSSLNDLFRTFFPVQRDLGYTSYIWLLLPLYLLVMVFGGKIKGKLLPLRTDGWSRNASLLLMLGLAGWIEYFPLSHSFHTQLFMAPVFCLIVIGQLNKQDKNASFNWRRLVVAPFLVVLMLVTTFEVLVHLKGLHEKITQAKITLKVDMPARGLKLSPEYITSFEQFYKSIDISLQGQEGLPAIPASVDPLRAIFPFSYKAQNMFRMSVDWAWPNELIEPGFNQHFYKLVYRRKALIYGDSILAIPGYIPISLLEMPSPLGWFHSFYLPSADAEVKDPPVLPINEMYIPVECGSSVLHGRVLVPFGRLPESLLAGFDQLHVSIGSDLEFPQKLTELEYKQFMIPAMAGFDKKIGAEQFYAGGSDGKYRLRLSMTESNWIYLAKFFLYRGKLYNPRFSTTLAKSENDHPIIVAKPKSNECSQVVWSKAHQYTGNLSVDEDLYLALPGNRFIEGGPKTMYVQIVMKDKTTLDRYLRYGFKGSGVAGNFKK
jgi:hypothetical protein